MRRRRYQEGNVVLDKKTQCWFFRFYQAGKRKAIPLGPKAEIPTRNAALRRAEPIRTEINSELEVRSLLVRDLWKQFRQEKMSERFATRHAYESWARNHILPRWGSHLITDLQARPVELWLQALPLSPKSKVHVRGLIRSLWEYTMWRGDTPATRNPMELVKVRGATKRTRQPRSLTVEEFHKLIQQMQEPVRTMALVCVCFGLRISECLALKWSDIDWLNARLSIQRGVVCQHVNDVKTTGSAKRMNIDAGMLDVFKCWRQAAPFSADDDWMFSSIVKLGSQPLGYTHVWESLKKASAAAGIGHISSHCFRHTYRSWLDAVGTPIAVQQKMMRHSDIRTTMNIYGDVVTDEMQQAGSKVAELAIRRN
jgi:integrase